jgi:hypothetical protein
MKPLVLATAFLATGWAFGAGVDLELRSAKPQQLVLESPELRVFLVNRGKEPVSIALTAGSEPTRRIETGDGWLQCRNVLIVCAGVGDVRRIRIDPGGEVDMGVPPLDCPTAAMDGHADVKAWVDVPGRYRLQAESRLEPPAQSAGDTAEPDNTFTGVVTSNTVSIEGRSHAVIAPRVLGSRCSPSRLRRNTSMGPPD